MFPRFSKCLCTTTLIFLLLTATASAKSEQPTNSFGMENGYLRGVRIEMRDGRKLLGYVSWSSDAVATGILPLLGDRPAIFPQSLIDPTAYPEGRRVLELYIKLYPVSKNVLRRAFPDSEMRMVIATRSGTLRLPINKIARIRALRMRYDGIEATIDGLITYVHSRTMIRLLMSGTPFATFKNDDGHVLVSFNRQIGRKKLASIDAALTKKIAVIDAERTKLIGASLKAALDRAKGAVIDAERTKLIGSEGDAAFNKAWDQVMRRLQRRRVVSIEYITED